MAHRTRLLVAAAVLLTLLSSTTSPADGETGVGGYLCIRGIYPHLATHNQPDDPSDRAAHGECGTGAIVPWAGKLFYLTYPQHKTRGSNDKLYEVDAQMNLTVRPESVGGTHANRMIHTPSNQLIMGYYFIDAEGNVRVCDPNQLVGRMTATMEHLTDPANKVYMFDMEGAVYEVNVRDLSVTRLFRKPFPGWHGKGAYTAQGRVVFANNGERGGNNEKAYSDLKVGGEAVDEEAGALVEWDGERWNIVERKQFTDVTGPGGIYGSPSEDAPLWAIGWDKRSVILKLLDAGVWYTYRLPKASHSFDPRHGWFTEWPRIREIAPGRLMMCMHGTMFDFPIGFCSDDTAGLKPRCTHLRYVPDFCHWDGKVVIGADDASMMGNPLCGQAQSNLWFLDSADALRELGPRAGWGGVWVEDQVEAGDGSDPFLVGGYERCTVHLTADSDSPLVVSIEKGDGKGNWNAWADVPLSTDRTATSVPYASKVLAADWPWLRFKTNRDCKVTAYVHAWSPRPEIENEDAIFDSLATIDDPTNYTAGIVRPSWHNESLTWLCESVDGEGKIDGREYMEIELQGKDSLDFDKNVPDQWEKMTGLFDVKPDWTVDEASVVMTDSKGRRYRLPKDPAFARELPNGPTRGIREVASERYLANICGTFYEIPRVQGGGHAPDLARMKPVASHDKLIDDFCSWRGLLVLSGCKRGAAADGQFYGDAAGRGLCFCALDDLWRLGKPLGVGGPWKNTKVEAGEPSDPYLMTGYDQKRLVLSHDSDETVTFTLEIDFDHTGYHRLASVEVPPGAEHDQLLVDAHWLRITADRDCTATATLVYE